MGVSLAVVGGIIYPNELEVTLSSALIALGIIVGLLNITLKETREFLIATLALIIVTSLGGSVLGQVPNIGAYLEGIYLAILTFVVPASIIVAIKAAYSLEKD